MTFFTKQYTNNLYYYSDKTVTDLYIESVNTAKVYLENYSYESAFEEQKIFNRRFHDKMVEIMPSSVVSEEVFLENVKRAVDQHHERMKKNAEMSLEDFYSNLYSYKCNVTGKPIPFSDEYFYIKEIDEGLLCVSKEGMKILFEEIKNELNLCE